MQVVYKRYASLYFVMGIDQGDNELITLEVIHHYVEVLDRYFGNVCELDLIFNFHKVFSASSTTCMLLCLALVEMMDPVLAMPPVWPLHSSLELFQRPSGSCIAGPCWAIYLWPAYIVFDAAMPCPEDALVQAYFMLDEMLIAGELQEPSKKVHLLHCTLACCSA